MLKTRATRFGAALAAGALVLSACSDSFDRDAEVEELVESGLTQAQAECIVDTLVDRLGEDTLNERRDPTAEEEAIVFEITGDCVFGE